MSKAVTTSVIGTLVAAAGTAAASYRFKNFNKFTSMSIKLAIPVMAGLGLWSWKYETTVYDAQVRNTVTP